MSQNIAAWYTTKIRDKVTVSFQSHGGLLDGTMMPGDVIGNTVYFPIVGRTEVYKLTGAIERVPVAGPGLSTVPMQFTDFEASDWWRTQDAYKAGPNEEAALVTIIVNAIRRKRDLIKLQALADFTAGGPANGTVTLGAGNGDIIDILDLEQGRAQIAATGADESGEVKVFCTLPAMWFSQLAFYEEFGNAEWVGPDDTSFSKTQRARMKTLRGVTYIEVPDEYVTGPDANSLYGYMWHKDSMGAETPVNQEDPSITPQPLMQGTPYLIKSAISGAAIGIQGAGVKRLWFSKQAALIRPPRPVDDVGTP